MIVLTIFITIVTMTIFTISHPILAYYQDLPADNDSITYNIKWAERLKQSWCFMYMNFDEDVMELGCGNTTVAQHIAKVLPASKEHTVVFMNNKNLKLPESVKSIKSADNTAFQAFQAFTVICHYEAQDFFLHNFIQIIPHTQNLILEVDYKTLKTLKPWLEVYGFKKQRQYIFLSVWQKTDAMA